MNSWKTSTLSAGECLEMCEFYPRKVIDVLRHNLNSKEIKEALNEHYDHLSEREKAQRIKGQLSIFRQMINSMTPHAKYPDLFYTLKVYYRQKGGKGRMFADGSKSYANIARKLRATLARDMYDDVDIENAHPNFLEQFINKTGLSQNRSLTTYNASREDVLKRVMKEQDISRGSAKQLLLSLTNNGSGISTLEANKSTPILKGFALEYARDIGVTIEEIYELCTKNKDYKRFKSRKAKNPKGSTLNNILCHIENECLHSIVKTLSKHKYNVNVLCFDGCMIRKKFNPHTSEFTSNINDEMLSEVSNQCEKDCGYTIKLSIKQFVEGIDIDKVRKENKDEGVPSQFEMCETFHHNYGFENIVMTKNDKLYHYNEDTCLWEIIKSRNIGSIICEFLKNWYEERTSSLELKGKILKMLGSAKSQKEFGMMYYDNQKYKKDNGWLLKFNRTRPYHIPCGMNVIDIRDLTQRSLEKEDYFTFTINRNFIDKLDTTYVDDFMKAYFPNDHETYQSMRMYCGYSLTGLVHLKCLAVLWGDKDAGKSTFINIMQKALQSDGMIRSVHKRLFIASVDSQIESQYDAIEDGVRIGHCTEFKEEDRLNTDTIKRVTGNDTIRYRPMRSDTREFVNQTKFLVALNHLFKYDITDEAIDVRLRIYPFTNEFTDRDPHFEEDVDKHIDEFFTWFVLCARDFYHTSSHEIIETPNMRAKKIELQRDMNPLSEFATTRLELTDDEKQFNDGDAIYKHYYKFMSFKRKDPISKPKFMKLIGKSLPEHKKIDKGSGANRIHKTMYKYRLIGMDELI